MEKKEEQLQEKIKNQLFYRSVLWSTLGLAILISIGIIYRKQIQLGLQEKKTKEIKVQSEEALIKSRAELESFKNRLVEKTRQIELLENTNIAQLSSSDLENLRTNSILTESDWTNFKNLFEKVHAGYLARLKNQFPDLTFGEIRFIVLIKLALNNKEMAACLGVSVGAIRTMKSRLLKKLDLNEHESLEHLIDLV